jgi:regulatory protein
MTITSVKQQVKRSDRYSIYVDGTYSFSLSEAAFLESGLASGQEISAQQVSELKKLSADDKLYGRALRYAAMRPRSRWEIAYYLERKDASPPLIETILNKLIKMGLVNDEAFAHMFVADRQLLRPASRRKIIMDLKKKRIAEDIIQKVLVEDEHDEKATLRSVIERKRRQSKYQDDLKLMQYLARQGFNYGDIKDALNTEGIEED